MYKIVEEFADDHAVWAKDLLDAWDPMTRNGAESLKASPQEGWLGHYSLRGKLNNNFLLCFCRLSYRMEVLFSSVAHSC